MEKIVVRPDAVTEIVVVLDVALVDIFAAPTVIPVVARSLSNNEAS